MGSKVMNLFVLDVGGNDCIGGIMFICSVIINGKSSYKGFLVG